MTTDINSKFSTDNPTQFLDEIYEIDPLAAVRIADKWGNPTVTIDQNNAAWQIAEKQTIVPCCISCRWPLLEDNPHPYCEEVMATWSADDDAFDAREEADDEDDDITPGEVYDRAYSHFGNHELAREATELYPGDFM